MGRRGRHLAVLAAVLGITLAPVLDEAVPSGGSLSAPPPSIGDLLDQASRQGWNKLGIGLRSAMFGLALQGAPYREGTLDEPGPEVCRVTTEGFDCVTFVELSLNLARVMGPSVGKRGPTEEQVRDAVVTTRYRGGVLDGYTSRLHYTAEWIADNAARGVVKDVTRSLGGVRYPVAVSHMSTHPDSYAVLRENPALVDSVRAIEARVSATSRTYIPKNNIPAVEPELKTGDIVAITTSRKGLDYAHMGIIVRDTKGDARFLHASSANGQVTLDTTLGEYLASGPKDYTGVTVVRPVEPRPAARQGATATR
jgi:cell wall-associated NlpC family hydrolase